MRKARNHGFVLSLLINMVFRMEWLAIFAILLVLHFVLHWPLWVAFIPLGCWVLHSLIVTLVFSWAVNVGNRPDPPRVNKNPYSRGSENVNPYSNHHN